MNYISSASTGFLVFPIERSYKQTKHDRLALLQFYQSEFVQHVYSQSIRVELLIEQIKDVFNMDPIPVRGIGSQWASF